MPLLFLCQNCDYVIVNGARRKEERWEQSATEAIALTGILWLTKLFNKYISVDMLTSNHSSPGELFC